MSERMPESLEMRAARENLRYAPVAEPFIEEFAQERLVYVRLEPDPHDTRLVTIVLREPRETA